MQKPVGRPPRKDKDNATASSSEKGTKPGEMRKTYIVEIELAEKIELIAECRSELEKRNIPVKNVVNEFFRYMVNKYETLHGPLQQPADPDSE